MQIKFTDIDGLKTEYITLGKGRDLLFLHGGSVSFRTNLPLIKELSKSFRVWAFSFPGAGKSYKLAKNWEFGDYAEFVLKFCEKFTIQPIITGHSVGGAIALEFNAKYPKLARELFLFAPAGMDVKDSSRAVQQVSKNHLKVLLSGDPGMRKDILLNIFYHPLDLLKITNFFKELNIKKTLGKVKEKVTVFWGRDDKVLPVENLKRFEKGLKNCKSYVLDGGHEFLTENRERISEIVNSEVENNE
jgi:pimeloyl-ACP methyl ester carboxylesterase